MLKLNSHIRVKPAFKVGKLAVFHNVLFKSGLGVVSKCTMDCFGEFIPFIPFYPFLSLLIITKLHGKLGQDSTLVLMVQNIP